MGMITLSFFFRHPFSIVFVAHEQNWKGYAFTEGDVHREILGFAKWDVPHSMMAEQKIETVHGWKPRDPLPTGVNVPLCEDFFGQLDQICRKWMDDEKDTCKKIPSDRITTSLIL